MLKGHEEADEVFPEFTSKGTLSDFKPESRVDLSSLSSLEEVLEGGEYKDITLSDRAETIRLKKYGNKITLSWEAIINDDLKKLGDVPRKFGMAARRTVGDLVFSILTGNPQMADGTALFHASHSNLTTGGSSSFGVTSLSEMLKKMALQKDGEATLNIRPDVLLVPVAIGPDARQLIASEFAPGETQRVPNKVRNVVSKVLSDARLDTASATAFYLLANAAVHDVIEVAYLNGVEEPFFDYREGFDVDGMEIKIRHVVGAAPLSWRTMQKSAGA
jgi:hypothetical protein